MAYYSSIIKELDASRKLGSELALEKHQQDIQRSKLERDLQELRRSRKQYIDNQITQSKLQYEKHLGEDSSVSDQHKRREQRAAHQKAKVAQKDFQIERERLLKERNQYDLLDKQNRVMQKELLVLQTKSRNAHQDQDRKLFELDTRKNAILKLLQESRQRQSYHFERAKQLAL